MKATLQVINDYAINNPSELLFRAEKHYDREISAAAEQIAVNDDIKIVAIAGPSASGKTTSAHILKEKLEALGEKTEIVSLDNFYLPIEELPILPDGSRDRESVNSLDTALLNSCFKEIVTSGKTTLPKYNFAKKERILKHREINVSGKGIAIVEGLHALNPIITDAVPREKIFKIYVSVNRTIFDNDGKKLLSSRQIRLARRILRDRVFRGTSVKETLSFWKGVVEGEEKYLYCFKDTADMQIQTLHIYEPCLYRDDFLALKSEIDNDTDFKDYFLKTADALEGFVSLDKALIPENSLISEFVGNGKYKL